MPEHRLKIDVLTLFPGMLSGYLGESIIRRSITAGRVVIEVVDLRLYTRDRHRTADDRPYGGGAGMVLKPEPIFEAVDDLRTESSRVILLSPRGRTYHQCDAWRLAAAEHLILICGHYEGVDERVREGLVDEEISVGDYILTNGALAALTVIDSVVRLVPGVLGCSDSNQEESFSSGLLEYPQYTRPARYRGMTVPSILLSGNHQEVSRWRHERALEITKFSRPDLLSEEDTGDAARRT